MEILLIRSSAYSESKTSCCKMPKSHDGIIEHGIGPRGSVLVPKVTSRLVARWEAGALHRAGAHGDDVFDLHGFLDDEGLAVLDADEVAVEAGDGAEAFANLLLVGKQGAALDGFAVLRGVAQQGRHATLELGADIYYKRGLYFGIDAGIEDLERAVGLGGFVELAESGEETGLETDFASAVVVGVARLPIRQDDDARFELANFDGQGHAGGEGVFQAGVGEVEVIAPLQEHVLAGDRKSTRL